MDDTDLLKEIQGLRADIAGLPAALVNAIKGGPVPVSPPATDTKPVPVPVPVPSTTPVLQQPGVGIGALGLVLTGVLQALGVLGPTTGETATTAGQLLPIVSGGIAALGATGTFGSVLSALSTVVSMFAQGMQKK